MKTLSLIYKNLTGTFVFTTLWVGTLMFSGCNEKKSSQNSRDSTVQLKKQPEVWVAPDTTMPGASDSEQLIKYGRKLIENTSFYLGPHGTVEHISNGMNCQNCHL